MKYPFVKQEENKDCGVAALAMIIKYYGGNVDLETLRTETLTNKDGVSAYNLIKCAKDLGFEAIGLKTDITVNDIKLPCIAHVTIKKSYKHFIVIYEINKDKSYLLVADPEDKIKKISIDEFNSITSNIYITLKPLTEIPFYKPYNISNLLYNFSVSNKELILHILILSLISTIGMIVFSFFMQFILGSVGLINDQQHLVVISIIFFCIMILKKVSQYFKNKLLAYVSYKIDYSLITDIYNKIIHLPYSYFYNHTTGEIVSKIDDLAVVKQVISKLLLGLIVNVLMSTFALIILYFINSTLFFISIVSLVLYILVIIIFESNITSKITTLYNSKMIFYSYLVETISAYQTIKGINVISNIINKFKSNKDDYLLKTYELTNLMNFQLIIKDILENITYILIISVGTYLIINFQLTIAALLTFNILYSYFIEPLKDLLEMNYILKQGREVVNKLASFNVQTANKGFINKQIKGNIKIDNLAFKYNANYVCKNINMVINAGDKVLITGSSGSGKSTLLKLLKRYYQTDGILIDNNDINDYKQEVIDANISLVSQNEVLFNDSIINNLTVNRNISANSITKVSDMCMLDFINNNDLRYHYMIEENGQNLSGGQRQRLILARTLLSNSNIYLLDEALSQVAEAMERTILETIFKYYQNKTFICISHHNNNRDLFNKCFQLENGQLV